MKQETKMLRFLLPGQTRGHVDGSGLNRAVGTEKTEQSAPEGLEARIRNSLNFDEFDFLRIQQLYLKRFHPMAILY